MGEDEEDGADQHTLVETQGEAVGTNGEGYGNGKELGRGLPGALEGRLRV